MCDAVQLCYTKDSFVFFALSASVWSHVGHVCTRHLAWFLAVCWNNCISAVFFCFFFLLSPDKTQLFHTTFKFYYFCIFSFRQFEIELVGEHQITLLAWVATASPSPCMCVLPFKLCRTGAGGHRRNNPLRCIRKYFGIPDLPANRKLCIVELEVGPDALNSQILEPRLCHVLPLSW